VQVAQLYWCEIDGWTEPPDGPPAADLVLYFGSREMLSGSASRAALGRVIS